MCFNADKQLFVQGIERGACMLNPLKKQSAFLNTLLEIFDQQLPIAIIMVSILIVNGSFSEIADGYDLEIFSVVLVYQAILTYRDYIETAAVKIGALLLILASIDLVLKILTIKSLLTGEIVVRVYWLSLAIYILCMLYFLYAAYNRQRVICKKELFED